MSYFILYLIEGRNEYGEKIYRIISTMTKDMEEKFGKNIFGRLGKAEPKAREMFKKLKSLEGKPEYGAFLKEYLNVIGPAYFYDYANSDHDLDTILLPNFEENGPAKVASNKDYWGKVGRGEIVANLDKITCLVVHFEGDYDINPSEDLISILKPKVKNYRLVKLEKTGHIPWMERNIRQDFIRKLSAELN